MNVLMSIDVEDWFQVENLNSAISRSEWKSKQSRVEKNVDLILEILSNNNSKATFFVLGWIANEYPDLIKKISNYGHEIASHGYAHDLIYNLDKSEFLEDVKKSKHLLEDITGKEVFGYRAPCFSITDWAIDTLIDLGFKYDASLFPTLLHDRYGKIKTYKIDDKPVFELKSGFYMVTLSCLSFFNKKIPWAGGGYFRIMPYFIYKVGVKKILKEQNYFCFYIHPWEFDPGQPRVDNIKFLYKFRHYNNLKATTNKYKRLVNDFKFCSIIDILSF